MKKVEFVLLVVVVLLMAFVSVAQAQDIRVAWTYSLEEEAEILGFRIYDKDANVLLADNILPHERQAVISLQITTTMYMVAFDSYVESDWSNDLVWNPDAISAPGDFVRQLKYTNFKLVDPQGGIIGYMVHNR